MKRRLNVKIAFIIEAIEGKQSLMSRSVSLSRTNTIMNVIKITQKMIKSTS